MRHWLRRRQKIGLLSMNLQWPVALEHETKDHYAKSRDHDHWNLKEFRVIRIDAETMPKTPTWKWLVGTFSVARKSEQHGNLKTLQGALPIYLVEGQWYAGEVQILDAGRWWS